MLLELLIANTPTILSWCGVAGVGLTSYLSIKGSEKARTATTREEIVKAYIPAMISGVFTSACIVGGNYISNKRINTLNQKLVTTSAVASAAITQYGAYRDIVKETVGPEKEKEILEESLKREEPKKKDGDIIIGGLDRFYEPITQTYFLSTKERVLRAINQANFSYMSHKFLMFDEFLFFLGIENGGIYHYDDEVKELMWDPSVRDIKWINVDMSMDEDKDGLYYRLVYLDKPEFA